MEPIHSNKGLNTSAGLSLSLVAASRYSTMSIAFFRVFSLCFLMLSTALPVRLSAAQDYHIGVGDLLEIEVYNEPDLTKEVRVLTDGKISLPLLGQISAAGQTVQDLQDKVRELLAAKYLVSPQVTVFVKEFSSVFVFGEVKSPGSFPLTGKMTVFEAITYAGGFTEVANPSKVKVIRMDGDQQTSFEVNISDLTKQGSRDNDPDLQANDRVIVPRSFF